MSVLHPEHGPNPVHTVHRIGAASIGAFLVLFAVLGLSRGLDYLSTEGTPVMGLSTNGLLSTISFIVGTGLVVAAVRGGPVASTVSVVVGVLFLLSGLVNFLVMSTSMNLLAFRLPNVVFSIGVGFVLLVLGAYGRITGRLPDGSPYSTGTQADVEAGESPPAQGVGLAHADSELAAAERAQALHHATAEQSDRLRLVNQHRSHAERRRAWVASAAGRNGRLS